MKPLSSRLTIFAKVGSLIWIIGFGWSTLILWLDLADNARGAPPEELKWSFLVSWILGTAICLWVTVGLRSVRLDATHLHIKNYMKAAMVPVNMIADVTENRWISTVTIRFCAETEFGQKVTFKPTIRWLWPWSSHPVVAELKRLSGARSA